MSNLSLATFMGAWDTLKWMFDIKIQKVQVFCTILGIPKGRILHEGVTGSFVFVAENSNRCC